MQEFKHFYGNLADISLTSIDSKTFIRACPDLAFYNILWIDNISNRNFMASLEEKVNDAMNRIAPDWRKDAEQIKKDFLKARPDVKFDNKKTKEKFHDRYIFLDYGLKGEKLFHCGASSKDAGNKITTIMQIENTEIYHVLMEIHAL